MAAKRSLSFWKYCTSLLLLINLFNLANTLFVPEQLPTLLSFIYSNVPPIKKGHDSRFGIGFRLGNNADFQIQLELGPQDATLPLGTNGNKREVIYKTNGGLHDKLWIYRWKQQQKEDEENNDWDRDFETAQWQPPRLIDPDVVQHLSQLYKERPRP